VRSQSVKVAFAVRGQPDLPGNGELVRGYLPGCSIARPAEGSRRERQRRHLGWPVGYLVGCGCQNEQGQQADP